MADTTRQQPKQEALAIPMRGGMLEPTNFQEALQFAGLLAKSGMLPKNFDGNTGAVLVAIGMGAELGLPPMAALQNIAVINGRPSLWGDAVLAVCVSRSDCEDVIEAWDEKGTTAVCTVKRRGRSPIVRQFSIDDAKRAGLWDKAGPWKQYPQRMLQMRARGFALRDAFPDALRGIRIAEEERDVIDVTPREEEPKPITVPGVHKFGKAERRERAKQETKQEPAPSDDWANVGPPAMTDEETAELSRTIAEGEAAQ
jgi:hypothetical protein